MSLPLAQHLLLRSRDGGVREVELADRTVVRSSVRPDDAAANLVLLHGPADGGALRAAREDADGRFAGPSQLVVPLAPTDRRPDADVAAFAAHAVGRSTQVLHALAVDAPSALVAAHRPREEVEISTPSDPRAWHGLQVLLRHEHDTEDRGEDDDVLAARVADRRELLATGRARVVVARRFGTPVAAGVLVWDPRTDVGPQHAGLAVLTDLVTHPAHRGLGLAQDVAVALAAAHLRDFPRAMVGAVVPGGPPPVGGWTTLGRLLVVM